jgi:hypothetical protein
MGLNRWLGCIENPRTGRESTPLAPPVRSRRQVMVVGAGPAGLQERRLPFDAPRESAALAQVMLARFPADEYPTLPGSHSGMCCSPVTTTATSTSSASA